MVARDRVITLRLSSEEQARFEAVAKDMGLSVSMMLRALVREKEKENNHGIREEKDSARRQRRSK
jgi:antitoxin component of RelBE/YafQ-DinJ toxin-antitoxin module